MRYKNLALLLTGILLGLFIAETALRIFKPPQLSLTQMPCIYIKDEQLGYTYKPNATGWIHRNFEIDNIVKTNSIGFHDTEHKVNGEVPRLLVIGDSFTASIHIDISNGWTQTLEREMLQTYDLNIEVVNLGLDGTGTDVHLDILEKHLPIFKPELVILAFYENDVEDVLKKRKFRECYERYVLSYQNEEEKKNLITFIKKHKPGIFSSWLFKNLYLFRLMTYLHRGGVLLRTNYITPSKIGIGVIERADNPINIEDLFKKLIALSQDHNFQLLIIPITPKDNPIKSLNTLRQNISESTQSRLNIIDISPIVQKLLNKDKKSYYELFWKYDGHFNAYGNQIFGLAAAEIIKNYLDISPIDR